MRCAGALPASAPARCPTSYAELDRDVFAHAGERMELEHVAALAPDDAVGLTHGHDVTGLKVWDGAHLLCRYLADHTHEYAGRALLELGAGVGLAGIFAARTLRPARLVLTDFAPDVLAVLRRNVARNVPPGVFVRVEALDWGADKGDFLARVGGRFDLIYCSDVLCAVRLLTQTSRARYALEAVPLLFATLRDLVASDGCVVVLWVSRGQRVDARFRALAGEYGFTLAESIYRAESDDDDEVRLAVLTRSPRTC